MPLISITIIVAGNELITRGQAEYRFQVDSLDKPILFDQTKFDRVVREAVKDSQENRSGYLTNQQTSVPKPETRSCIHNDNGICRGGGLACAYFDYGLCRLDLGEC